MPANHCLSSNEPTRRFTCLLLKQITPAAVSIAIKGRAALSPREGAKHAVEPSSCSQKIDMRRLLKKSGDNSNHSG
jgi:hypothetical protein